MYFSRLDSQSFQHPAQVPSALAWNCSSWVLAVAYQTIKNCLPFRNFIPIQPSTMFCGINQLPVFWQYYFLSEQSSKDIVSGNRTSLFVIVDRYLIVLVLLIIVVVEGGLIVQEVFAAYSNFFWPCLFKIVSFRWDQQLLYSSSKYKDQIVRLV